MSATIDEPRSTVDHDVTAIDRRDGVRSSIDLAIIDR
jgi:hypothetical protein